MEIKLRGENFLVNATLEEDDETKIEEFLKYSIPIITPEIQAAIDAKYGTLAERQARKAAGEQPMTLETLAARVAVLEEELKTMRNATSKI